jgi:hypothetical protein
LFVDFDLYLLRPGRGDIVLNQSRVIADYRIARNVRIFQVFAVGFGAIVRGVYLTSCLLVPVVISLMRATMCMEHNLDPNSDLDPNLGPDQDPDPDPGYT